MTIPGLRLPVFVVLILGFPLLLLLWIGIYAIRPGPPSSLEQIEVVIPARSGVSAVRKILAANHVIRDDPRFSMLVMITGASTKLRAGEYAFKPGKRPLAVIELLKKGKVLYRPVTIPEGTGLAKVAEMLAADNWVDRDRFSSLVHDPDLLAELGVRAESFEGFLFPDTYYLSRGQQDETEIIRMMVARHRQIYREVIEAVGAEMPLEMTDNDIITLASIVEKETGNPEERSLVAGVFLNRLKKGMRLQADPTVRYGLGKKGGPLTRSELKNSTPYNTYIISGLPPGPISNPGRAAIEAVLSPAETDYLYFVAIDDTSHHFSRTLAEHNRAVARYRRRQ